MFADIGASSGSTTTTSSATSYQYRNITAAASAMQHLQLQTLNNLKVLWQHNQQHRCMCWQHCNYLHFYDFMFGGGITTTIDDNKNNKNNNKSGGFIIKQRKSVCVKRIKRLDNIRLHCCRRGGIVSQRRGVSMKLFMTTSSMSSDMMRAPNHTYYDKNQTCCCTYSSPGVASYCTNRFALNQYESVASEDNFSICGPRSKWHSTSISNQANLAQKPTNPTATTNKSDIAHSSNTLLQSTTRATQKTAVSKNKIHTITITTNSEQTESIVLMIQEPLRRPQTDLIELPTVEVNHASLSSKSTTSTKSSLLNAKVTNHKTPTNLSQSHTTTIVRIPKQNSRPRIFLLTRPAKPSLVRTATQTVPAQTHHPLLQAATSQAPIPKSFTILKKQCPTNSSNCVKINRNQVLNNEELIQVPQEESQYRKITVQYPYSQSEHKLPDSLANDHEVNQYPQTNCHISSSKQATANQSASEYYQVLTKSVKRQPTIPQNTVYYNLANKRIVKGPHANAQIPIPLTLASMAGIELTGADMSLTAADMSGAMPPTATVEEINVPVFIDEYLQEAAAISCTATTAAAASVTTNNNSNSNIITYINDNSNNLSNNFNNNNNNLSNYQQSNGKGNNDSNVTGPVNNNNNNSQNNNCLETLDNFEFDIDLLAGIHCDENEKDNDNGNNQDKASETQLLQRQQQQLFVQPQQQISQQQQQLNLHNSVNEAEKQKQQLQLMLEEILSNTSSNNNNNQSCNTYNNNYTSTTTNNNNTTNTTKMAYASMDDLNEIFNVAPNSQVLEEILSPLHDMDMSNLSPTMENAVDFNQIDNEELFLDMDTGNNNTNSCFINSQPNHIMFSNGILSSQPSSQNSVDAYPSVAALSQEILEAEPHVPPESIHCSSSSYAQVSAAVQSSSSNLCDFAPNDEAAQFFDGADDEEPPKAVVVTTNPLKRHSTQVNKHLQEKRSKLRLDVKRSKDLDLTKSQDLDTPAIINSILQNEEFNICVMSPAENSMDIYNQLINSPHESIVKSEIDTGDYTNDITPPYTPYSVNSTSQQTNFTGVINTAPSSPASSIATTNGTTCTTQRRGRGRPAKLHSDVPDLSQVESELERKRALERYKNNEASRKSRLKNKERDMATEQEERILMSRNQELEADLERLKKIEEKLRQAIMQQYSAHYSHRDPDAAKK